jgi:transposase
VTVKKYCVDNVVYSFTKKTREVDLKNPPPRLAKKLAIREKITQFVDSYKNSTDATKKLTAKMVHEHVKRHYDVSYASICRYVIEMKLKLKDIRPKSHFSRRP